MCHSRTGGRGLCFDGMQVSILSLLIPNSFQVDVISGKETIVMFLSSSILPKDCYPFYGYAMPGLKLITAKKPNLYLGNPSSGLIFYSFYSPEGNRSSGHSAGLKNYPLTSKSTAISQLYVCFTPCCSVFLGSREEPLTHKKRQTAAQCTDLPCPALENATHMAW